MTKNNGVHTCSAVHNNSLAGTSEFLRHITIEKPHVMRKVGVATLEVRLVAQITR